MTRGFTLVETLVALFVFALIAATGVFVLGNSASNSLAIEDANGRLQALQRARAALRADLAQMAARGGRDESGAPRPVIAGGNDLDQPILAFTRRGWENPDAASRASMQYVEYRIVEGRLERRAAPMLDGAELGPPAVLLEGVQGAELEFFLDGAWSDRLLTEGSGIHPRAVRLDLRLADFGLVEQIFVTAFL